MSTWIIFRNRPPLLGLPGEPVRSERILLPDEVYIEFFDQPLLQCLQIRLHARQVRIDRGGALERGKCLPVLAQPNVAHTQPRHRAEMPGLQSQHFVDVLGGCLKPPHRVQRRSALVPALGEARCQHHDTVEEFECSIVVALVQASDALGHHDVDRLIPGLGPDRPDQLLDRPCRFGRWGGLQGSEQRLEARIVLVGRSRQSEDEAEAEAARKGPRNNPSTVHAPDIHPPHRCKWELTPASTHRSRAASFCRPRCPRPSPAGGRFWTRPNKVATSSAP